MHGTPIEGLQARTRGLQGGVPQSAVAPIRRRDRIQGVAQLRRAPALGAGGRRFDSFRPDQFVVAMVYWHASRAVNARVLGSEPGGHPKFFRRAAGAVYRRSFDHNAEHCGCAGECGRSPRSARDSERPEQKTAARTRRFESFALRHAHGPVTGIWNTSLSQKQRLVRSSRTWSTKPQRGSHKVAAPPCKQRMPGALPGFSTNHIAGLRSGASTVS